MLIGSSSDFNTVQRIAEGVARSGAHLVVMRCAHTYDIIEFPSALDMSKRLEVLKEDKREPVAMWVAGKRTK
jgi:hypothetical protein